MKKKIKFTIFCNKMFGETKKAWSFQELLDSMSKRHKEFWSNIMFKDEDGKTINITREFLQDMTFDEVVNDWIAFGDTEQTIHTI